MKTMRRHSFILGVALLGALLLGALPDTAVAAGLVDRVPEAFVSVFGRQPSATEKAHWTGRVNRKEKTTYEALRGAMQYHKDRQSTGATASNAADKPTMIKEVLPMFIRIYGNNPTDAEKAWWRKRISCGEIKNMAALESSMHFHHSKKVRKGGNTICGGTAAKPASSGGVIRRSVAGIGSHPMGDQVRIGIFKTNGSAIEVTADTKFQIREGGSKILATLGKDDTVKVSWSGGKYHIRGSGVEEDTTNVVRFVPLDQGIVQIKSYSDPSVTYPGKNYNRFRGVVEIRKCEGCNELWAINELRTEYYLRGLAETSGNGPEEYLKALGTAARTYVLYHKIVTGGRYPKQGFDIGNTADDQLYRGYEYELVAPKLATVFGATKGTVVADGEGDKLLTTVYFSDSDGRTRSAQERWNSSRFPHLQSVDDPHHASSSCKGHCVGMSAQGAYGFAAKDDWSFQRILTYFYKGIKLVKAY